MRRRHVLAATLAAAALAAVPACGASDAGSSSSPPPGASDTVQNYVQALNDRDTKALLAVGAAPDKPWSRRQANKIIESRGGKGLTITKAPIEYEQMGDYMGKAALTTSDEGGKTVRETVDLIHEDGHWHVVLFEWPQSDKTTSAT